MKTIENRYFADKGNFIVRKVDGFIMGEDIDLGTGDSIENYEEKPFTEETFNAFYKSIGISQKKEEPTIKLGKKRHTKK